MTRVRPGAYTFPFFCWCFFLLAGLLTTLVVPIGEGFDEPWHLAYVQYIANTGSLPPGPRQRLSSQLQEFLEIGPVGTVLHDLHPELEPHDRYWMAAPEVREFNDSRQRGLTFSSTYVEAPGGFEQYESHQPPLFYVLWAPVFRLASGMSLPSSFLIVRIWSVLIASTLIPLTFLLVRELSESTAVANAAALLTAMFPGIYPDLARVSNDALAVPLATATCLLLARYIRTASRSDAIALGALLVTGLATKAFFIPILASVLLVLIILRRWMAAGAMLAASLPGWVFYFRNAAITGSFTGLPETVEAKTSIASSLAAAFQIDWILVVRQTAATHTWTGFWSLLQLRSWMYDVVFFTFLLAIPGFLLYLRQSKHKPARAITVVYAVFLLALAYYATQTYQRTTSPIIQGWYVTPFAGFEAAIFAIGVAQFFKRGYRTAVFSLSAFCLLALFIYATLFVAAPYYTGLTSHGPTGHLRAYSPALADIPVISSRAVRWYPFLPDATVLINSLAVFSLGIILIAGLIHTSDKRRSGNGATKG